MLMLMLMRNIPHDVTLEQRHRAAAVDLLCAPCVLLRYVPLEGREFRGAGNQLLKS